MATALVVIGVVIVAVLAIAILSKVGSFRLWIEGNLAAARKGLIPLLIVVIVVAVVIAMIIGK